MVRIGGGGVGERAPIRWYVCFGGRMDRGEMAKVVRCVFTMLIFLRDGVFL